MYERQILFFCAISRALSISSCSSNQNEKKNDQVNNKQKRLRMRINCQSKTKFASRNSLCCLNVFAHFGNEWKIIKSKKKCFVPKCLIETTKYNFDPHHVVRTFFRILFTIKRMEKITKQQQHKFNLKKKE